MPVIQPTFDPRFIVGPDAFNAFWDGFFGERERQFNLATKALETKIRGLLNV